MRRVLAVLCTAVVSAVGVVPAAAQTTTDPLCGPTLTGPVTLDRDLGCDVTLGDGARLDLGGHTIGGTVSFDPAGDGIADDVEIRNGSVERIYVFHAAPRVFDASVGNIVMRLGDVAVVRSRVSVRQIGANGVRGTVSVEDSTIDRIADCSTCEPLRYRIVGSTMARVGNSLVGGEVSADFEIIDSDVRGLHLEDSSLDLRGSRVTGDVWIRDAGHASFVDNQFTAAGISISEEILGVSLHGNVFADGRGVSWSGGSGTTDQPATIEVRQNRFLRSGGPGLSIYVDAGVGGSVRPTGAVVGNRFVGNAFDGLNLVGAYVGDVGGVRVAGNVAARNDDFGIAAEGVIDGGGNRASGNGEPDQCLGVVCAPK